MDARDGKLDAVLDTAAVSARASDGQALLPLGDAEEVADVVPVALPLPLDGPFDYRCAPVLPPGTYVEVPFGPRHGLGVVWDAGAERRVPPSRLKPVLRPLDLPPMPAGLRRLVAHLARETLAPLGAALRLALPPPAAMTPQAARMGVAATAEASGGRGRATPARRRVLEVARAAGPLTVAELARRAGVGAGVVKGLLAQAALTPVVLPAPKAPAPDPERPGPALSPVQRAAAAAAIELAEGGGHGVLLLDGVPGSGKTEVYFEAIAAALRRDRQVLVLLPEIALSPQWLERFAARFGAPPLVWHSEVRATEKRRTWHLVAGGRASVVVGARSALFLPFDRLGLIVVDEEHDASFKQDDGVCYHARDMALARARFEDCPAILASATPALETALAAGLIGGQGRGVAHRHLPERHAGARLPAVELVDLKTVRPPRGAWLAAPVRAELAATLASGAQALLFLNRRGFAPLTLCRACGHRLACPNCSAWLVEHRLRRRLVCHHCGLARPVPPHCPACGGIETLAACGPGVERLHDEVCALHPAARIAVLTSDTLGTATQAGELVRAMADGTLDVLIGTQLVAKGHHFPGLALVVVVDGDLGLAGGDLRAAERSFQLLYQVAGRAGRAERPGRVLIQTHLPEHPLMQALRQGDRDGFYRSELRERRLAGMPPLGRLAAIVVSGPEPRAVQEAARRLARAAPDLPGLRVLGPAPAPLALLRGRHRQRLLVKATLKLDLPTVLRPWLATFKPTGAVRVTVDVDPYSFL